MTRAVNLASAGSIVSESVGTAPGYMARAWVNFNGTGTVAIRASGNVSSITDNGTGDYTVNFTTAMPDANYSVSCSGRNTSAGLNINPYSELSSVSALRVTTYNTSWVAADPQYVYVAIFR